MNNFYDWLQVGEEDLDSSQARKELVHSPEQLTREKILSLQIKKELYKIKNHTALVCLDQLKQDGLTLDSVVSQEIDRIPREYLKEVFYWNENISFPFKLKTGDPDSFGNGLLKSR